MEEQESLDKDLKHFLLCFEEYKKLGAANESEKQKVSSDLDWSRRQERILREQLFALQAELKSLRALYTDIQESVSHISYLQTENMRLSSELKRKMKENEDLIESNYKTVENLRREFSEKQENMKKTHEEEMKVQTKRFVEEKQGLVSELSVVKEALAAVECEKKAILSENNDLYMNIKLAYESEIAKLRDDLADANAKFDAQNEKFRFKWQSMQKANFTEKHKLKQQLDDVTARNGVLEADLQAALKRNENLENDLKKYTKYFKSKKSVYDDLVDLDDDFQSDYPLADIPGKHHPANANAQPSSANTRQRPLSNAPDYPKTARGGQRARGASSGPRRGRGTARPGTKKLNLLQEENLPLGPYKEWKLKPHVLQPSYVPSYTISDDDFDDPVDVDPDCDKRSREASVLNDEKGPRKNGSKKRKLYTEFYDQEF